MKFKKIHALLLAEICIIGGVLIHHRNALASTTRGFSYDEIVSPVETHLTSIEALKEIQEQERLKEEALQRVREREEAEKQRRIIQEEEERRRREEPYFNPYNVSELSNLSKEQISKMLEGTALQTLVNAFYWYEKEYQVNAIFLMSLTAEESAWGRSKLAIQNNNLAGHKDGSNTRWAYYNNWGESLKESFRLLSEEYIDPNGLFYTGPNIYDINLTYCPDPVTPNSWANNIITIANELLNKI